MNNPLCKCGNEMISDTVGYIEIMDRGIEDTTKDIELYCKQCITNMKKLIQNWKDAGYKNV